jgi:hypothetical protein
LAVVLTQQLVVQKRLALVWRSVGVSVEVVWRLIGMDLVLLGLVPGLESVVAVVAVVVDIFSLKWLSMLLEETRVR